MKNAKKVLEEKNISPSLQRVIILKYLQEHKNHPTVDELYNALRDDIPTLSKTTVYNTLRLFSDSGIVHQLSIPGNEAHYDFEGEFHAHFICEKCGGIYDIDMGNISMLTNEYDGHSVRNMEVIYRGICKECRK